MEQGEGGWGGRDKGLSMDATNTPQFSDKAIGIELLLFFFSKVVFPHFGDPNKKIFP